MPYYSMSKLPSQPKTPVPETPKPVIEPLPEKPKSRLRRGNPALNKVGAKLSAEASAEAAAAKAQRDSSRQEVIAVWKKMT